MKIGSLMSAMIGSLLDATTGWNKQRVQPKSPFKDHVIVGKRMQGYLTGQKIPSQRPVYRAQYVSRSKYTPHQGAQECERRCQQGWGNYGSAAR